MAVLTPTASSLAATTWGSCFHQLSCSPTVARRPRRCSERHLTSKRQRRKDETPATITGTPGIPLDSITLYGNGHATTMLRTAPLSLCCSVYRVRRCDIRADLDIASCERSISSP
ncbi:hypothetical protein BDW22DRAFT_1357928 [Trametopsis cervina]|nr:hypothetical protein BDW22DRAFT_1357928 [Trametopsis cervina]